MNNMLIVEDDDFKYKDIFSVIERSMPGCWFISRAKDAHTAIELVNKNDYFKIIVDMSIPSHPTQRGAGTAHNLAIGGHEIIFEMELLDLDGRCIVLTQYPEIEIEQVLVPINESKNMILEKFQCKVIACIQYSEENDWKIQLIQALKTS